MAIGEFTLQQLKDGCRMGMLDSWGEQVYKPKYEDFVEDKDILEYVIVNRHEFNSINGSYLHFKRPEIRTEDWAIPYSTRLGKVLEQDVYVIQQLDFDNMSAKIVGMPEQIKLIKGNIRRNTVYNGMTDDEFWEAHRRDLGQYKNIPHLHGLVEGNFNPTPEKVDIHGQHITTIDDYDNYDYIIYGVSHNEYIHIRNVSLKRKKFEDVGIYYEEKLDKWKNDIKENGRRIIKVLQNKGFIYEISKYDFQDGAKLSQENIMTELCKKYNVSYKGGWATWKFLNANRLEEYILNEEFMENNNPVPYLFQ